MSTCRAIGERPDYETSSRPGGMELTARAVTLAGIQRAATIADLGCGRGETVDWLRTSRGSKAVGIDRERRGFVPGLPLLQAVAEHLPFASRSFDALLAECSLSVMRARHLALAECARVLKPHGTLIVTDLYARNPSPIGVIRNLGATCLAGMIVRDELDRQLAAHGFRVRLWEDHSHVLKQFLFRYFMEHESSADLWGCDGASGVNDALRQAQLGYFLLIAETKGDPGDGR